MKRRLIIIAAITLLGFPLLGWLILFFTIPNPWEIMFRGDWSILSQLLMGTIIGLALGVLAQKLVSLPFLKQTEVRYARLVRGLGLNHVSVIFISICAGFGEELLFRGAIQPFAGIWITAIIFVGIHGYLDPRNWKLSIYGIYMTLAIVALGYMTEKIGIFSACMAHACIDYVLFQHLRKFQTSFPFIQKL